MHEINVQLLRWMAAGDDPGSWMLLAGCLIAQWGGTMCAAVLCWAAFAKSPDRVYILAVAATAVGGSVISHLVAAGIGVQRPFVQGLAPGYVLHSADGSMPSAHASVMFFIAFSLMARDSLRRIGWLLGLLAVATAWARIYVGLHFPAAIGFGVALGAFFSCLFVIVCRARLRRVADRDATRQPARREHLPRGAFGRGTE